MTASFSGVTGVRARITPGMAILTTCSVLLAFAYLRWTPSSPDLAAQVARADVNRQVGSSSWWTGWFGGISMPSYSVLVPTSMAALGVRLTGLVATAAGAIASARLLRGATRPRAGAAAFALTSVADLVDGRVTFVVGVAVGVWGLLGLRAGRSVLASLLAVGSYFASPLAALFLGLVFVGVIVVEPKLRRAAICAASSVLLLGIAMALLFPGTGTMPFNLSSAVVPALCCLGVIAICPQRIVRIVAVLALTATAAFVLVPGAVGSNITRLVWISAAPVAVAFARIPRRWLVPAVALLAAWPLTDTIGQLRSADNASAQPAFYRPVAAAMMTQRRLAGAGSTGQRLEVVDTANHWASVYLADQSLARGWDRQADNADNPIFYKPGALNATSYQQWLTELAVGWVALPAAPLDFASVAEGNLVHRGLPYLQLTFSDSDWLLYRVVGAAPLAAGAQVRSVDANSVTLTTMAPGTTHVRLRWSPYLSVIDPVTRQTIPACVTNDNGWLALYLPKAETVAVTSDFTVATRLRTSDPDCEQDVSLAPGGP